MLKMFCLFLLLLFMFTSFAQEGESYSNEDFMVDPKISATEQGKIKRQVGEAGHESISADHVIAGDRFDDSSLTDQADETVTPSPSQGANR